MDVSVSLPDPGEFDRGHHNGHATGLVFDQLHPYDLLDHPTLPGNGILPLHPADITDLLTTPGFAPTPDLVDEQTHALQAEFRAALDHFDSSGLRDTDLGDGSSCNPAHQGDSSTLLPGFETLTWGDLRTCPPWCADADLPVHGDGLDPDDTAVPHRGVPHDIPIRHGGSGLDHVGRASVSLQVEQDRELTSPPAITLSVVVRGIEQYAWLTTTEARTLRRTLAQLLDDLTDND